uniref:Homeobox protein Hox-A9b n=1 Tax=Cacopsylla melanoneura TaxID=428564 RepID=A0A8D8SNG2_9HEMI
MKDIHGNFDLSQIHKNLLQCNTGRFRQVYSSHQIIELEKEFRLTNYLPSDRRKVLSKELGLSERQIKIWFQNRRMKLKRTNPEAVVEYVKESRDSRGTSAERSSSQNSNKSSLPSSKNGGNPVDPSTHGKSFEDFIREHYERNSVPFPPGLTVTPTGDPGQPVNAVMEENTSKLLLEKLREQTLEKHLRGELNNFPAAGSVNTNTGNTNSTGVTGPIDQLNHLYENERNLLIQELIRNKLGLMIQQNGVHVARSEEVPTDLSRRLKSDTEEEAEVKQEDTEEEDSANE